MWCHRSLGRRLYTACQKPKEEISSAKGKGKSRRFRREKSDGKGRGGSSNYPIVEVYNDGSKTQTTHMKAPPGYAVLDCGAATSLCGAKPLMAQTHASKKNELETSATLRQSMRVIISEESEIRLSVHS